MSHRGDFLAGATVRRKFVTGLGTGARSNASSDLEAADFIIYRDDSAAQRTSSSGVTVTSAFDGLTGVHHLSIDTSNNADAGFFAAGHDYSVMLYPDETVDSVLVANEVMSFSIENRNTKADVVTVSGGALSASPPVTVTAIDSTVQTALVSAIWAALVSGITTVGSIGKLIKDNIDAVLSTTYAAIVALGTRLPAALVGGRMDASVGAMAAGVQTNASFNADSDIYGAIVRLTRNAGGASDTYAVDFLKNGQPLNTGITVPTIQIVDVENEIDAIAATPLTEVLSTGIFKKTTTTLIDAGVAHVAILTFAAGGSTRTARWPISRDA